MNDFDIFNGVLGIMSNNRMNPIVERSAGAISTLRSRDMQQGLGVAPFGGLVDVPAARSWLALWLSNRRLQLAENAGGTREGARAAQSQNKNLWGVPAYGSVADMNTGYNRDYISKLLAQASSDSGVAGKVSGYRADFHKNVLDEANKAMGDPRVGGVYVSDGMGHRLAVSRGTVDGPQSDMVHELAHAMEAKPQESKISEIMKGAKIDGGSNPYLESPTEIHSRLMQIRHDLGLDPRKNYTIDDLKELKEKGNKYNILDRYDDDTILRLLNEVAAISTPTKRNTQNS